MQGRYRLLKLFPAAVICITTLAATSVQADEERYRKMNWEESLQLTEEQQQDIRRIENAFRKQIHDMDASDVEARKNEFDRMREEIRAVLTEEQRELAHKQMEDQQKKLQLRNLGLLARALDLEPEQKRELKQTILAQQANWPMDKEQWDNFREAFDQKLHQVLTEEQLSDLEAMRERQRAKWQHHTMEMLKGHGGQTSTASNGGRPVAPPPLAPPPPGTDPGAAELPPEMMSPGDPVPAIPPEVDKK